MSERDEDRTEAKVGEWYEHQKGGVYEVIAIAKHTETTDEMVVYRSQSDGEVYTRPRPLFEGDREGKPRFVSVERDEDRTKPPPGWERYMVTDDDGVLGESLNVHRTGPATVSVEEAWKQRDLAAVGYALEIVSSDIGRLVKERDEARTERDEFRMQAGLIGDAPVVELVSQLRHELTEARMKVRRLESTAVNLRYKAADAERLKKHWKTEHRKALEGTKLAEVRAISLQCVHSDCGKCLGCENYRLDNNIRAARRVVESLIAWAITTQETCRLCGSSWTALGETEVHDETCPVPAARELLEAL